MSSGWKKVAIGDVVDSAKTWNPLRSVPNDVFDYIDLSAIDQDSKTIIGARKVICGDAPSRARQLVAKGDVLVSTVRPNLNGVALISEELDGATASTGFCVLSPRRNFLDRSYLFHWVKSPTFISDMVNKATGANYPAVSDRIIFESQIPLPPFEEQRRIAELLDRAEELRSKRREAIAQLDTLTQAIFLEMFGDPVRNPKLHPVVRLGSLTKISSGSTPSRKQPENFDGNIPWVKTTEVNGYLITDTEEKITKSALQNSSCHVYPVGSILIALYGQGKTRGQCAVLGIEAATNQACGVLLPNPSYITNFLFAQLSMSYSRLRAMARGGNQENLNLGLIADFTVLLPCLPLQQEFAHRVEAVEKIKAAHCASLSELNALFASLQNRAFKGEL